MNSYIVSFERKRDIPITQVSIVKPSIQRSVDVDVIVEIMNDQEDIYKKYGKYLIPGCLSIGSFDNREYIIDGQHRLEAYKALNKLYPERALHVDIDYYEVNSEEGIELLYKRVNTCTPNPIAVLEINPYKIHEQLKKYFTTNYKQYLSTSKNCKAPNIHIDTLFELIQNRLLRIVNWSGDQIIEQIIALNKYYSAQTEGVMTRWGVDRINLDKAKKHSPTLHLAAYRNYEWIDRLIDIYNGNAIASLQHFHVSKQKDVISKPLRIKVWNKRDPPENAIHFCYCCKGEIQQGVNFVCGHIIPRACGGQCIFDNLEPICNECNADMRTMHLAEYMKLTQEQTKV
jgi:5-methylcytosine-specific restriction endonuclease McrA